MPFGSSTAIIHAGTALRSRSSRSPPVWSVPAAVSTRLAIAVVAVNALFVLLALYTPSLTPLPGTSYSPIAAILAAAGLLG